MEEKRQTVSAKAMIFMIGGLSNMDRNLPKKFGKDI